MNIKILIAAHKPYRMPADEAYMPLHVGSVGKDSIGFERDDTGDNISDKNPNFCELTALYWGYKNLDADVVGLAHYRRHFKGKTKSKDKFLQVLGAAEIEKIMSEYDMILPKKRNYYIETVRSHYEHTHEPVALDVTRRILEDKYPDYVDDFDRVMKRTSAHMFNMFIAKKPVYDAYCEWLFDILFELEKRLDISKYSKFEARVFGRVSEFLINVWAEKNNIKYKEVPFIYMENPRWNVKIKNFLMAKFFRKKYGASV